MAKGGRLTMQRLSSLVVLVVLICGVAAVVPGAASAAPAGVIVQFQPGVSKAQQRGLLGLASVRGRIYGTTAQVLRVPLGQTAGALARLLNRSGLVSYAEVDGTLRALATAAPNDPQLGQLYGLDRIRAAQAWGALSLGAFPATGGAKVGIVDTGIRATHQDLAGKVVDCATITQPLLGLLGGGQLRDGTCADANGHGTHVAGTVAATANNGVGVAGIAFSSPLAICKGLGDGGSGSLSVVASCIRWLKDRGAKVISLSLGGSPSTTLQQAVQYAYDNGNGALVVAAAGNDANTSTSYPAGYPEVVSVAATDQADAHAAFSNVNPDVEISAPGVGILSTWNASDSAYRTLSGTSMATPHVAGVAALIRTRFPALTAAQARTRLDAATDDLGAPGRDATFGFGRVNALKAVTARR